MLSLVSIHGARYDHDTHTRLSYASHFLAKFLPGNSKSSAYHCINNRVFHQNHPHIYTLLHSTQHYFGQTSKIPRHLLHVLSRVILPSNHRSLQHLVMIQATVMPMGFFVIHVFHSIPWYCRESSHHIYRI